MSFIFLCKIQNIYNFFQVSAYNSDAEANNKQVWVKKLAPLSNGLNPYAVLYFNQESIGVPAIVSAH